MEEEEEELFHDLKVKCLQCPWSPPTTWFNRFAHGSEVCIAWSFCHSGKVTAAGWQVTLCHPLWHWYWCWSLPLSLPHGHRDLPCKAYKSTVSVSVAEKVQKLLQLPQEWDGLWLLFFYASPCRVQWLEHFPKMTKRNRAPKNSRSDTTLLYSYVKEVKKFP